tara:strand:- start:5019 stop:5450 length:432 start_codon:yes stop_codon:yes gene_type:complete
MKSSELKKLIKPLVKQCIHESLLEEGLLSSVISEVVKGLNVQPVLREQQVQTSTPSTPHDQARIQEVRQQIKEDKRTLLDSFKQETFNGVNIFEGTEALSEYESGASSTQQGAALSNVDPRDAGVDITNIVALGGKNWKALIS